MNWKVVVIGGIVFYIVTFILGFFVAGPLLHDNVLKPIYEGYTEFWRPELNQDPPDMMSLLPRWIAVGLLGALVIAALYDKVRGCFSGAGWRRGLVFGLWMAILNFVIMLAWSGVFALPLGLWLWWSVEGFVNYMIGGAVLGLVAAKLAPSP